MKKIIQYAFLFITLMFFGSTSPAHAQAFLNPVTPQAPSFLETGAVGTGAYSTGGALENQNNSSNLLTGPGAFNAGVMNGRKLSRLQTTQQALMAPASVNMKAFPSGSYSYGFSTSVPAQIFGGRGLPTVSTGSVDLNIVDCPNLAQNYGPNQINPWAANDTLYLYDANGVPISVVDFQETQNEATSFIQSALDISAAYSANP